MQLQSVKPDGVLGVVVPPFVVVDFADRLEGVVILARDAGIDKPPRDPRGVADTEVGGPQNRPQRPLGRDRISQDIFTAGCQHAAEVLRPRTVYRRIQNHVTDMPGPQFLRLGRESEESIDFTLREQVERLELGVDHPPKILFGIEPHLSRHQPQQ